MSTSAVENEFDSGLPPLDRREFLSRAGAGCGMLALTSLLHDELSASSVHGATRPHHPAKAKSVIWIFMNGGQSSIDLYNEKPALKKWDGTFNPDQFETLFPHPGPIMRSPYSFRRCGEVGATISEVYPHLAGHVDEMTFLHACVSQVKNHFPASCMVNSGVPRAGSPCLGSWVNYGLGSENRNLPGFVVMYDHRTAPEGGTNLWSPGFLPGEHQGVTFRSSSNPILYLKRPDASRLRQLKQLQLLRDFNHQHASEHPSNGAMQARIRSFETAYRMQSAAPALVDLSRETLATRRLYGLDVPECRPFGTQLLLARRMVEQGVRFVQIYHGGWNNNWDSHGGLEEDHRKYAFESDRTIAGLLADLKQRGLLESTLVVCAGEFGRLPISQERGGRDHNPFGFTIWLAGGGVRRGFQFGQTDELGYKPIENPVTMHDLHATILHLLGIDHAQLSFRHNGREQTLTNALGDVVHEIL